MKLRERRYLVVVIILILLINFIPGCSSKNENQVSGDQADAQNTIGEKEEDTSLTVDESHGFNYEKEEKAQVWTFDYSVDASWDIVAPYINPLGEYNSYENHDYINNSYRNLSYINLENRENERYIYGDYWSFNIPFDEQKTEEENKQLIEDLKFYIDKMNGTLISKTPHEAIFVVEDQTENRWWGIFNLKDDFIAMEVIKENYLKIGEELIINPADYEDNTINFSSYHENNKFQTLLAKSEGGSASISIETKMKYDDYEKEYNQSIVLDPEYSENYKISNLPNEKGLSQWSLSWDSYNTPGEITLLLQEDFEQDKINYSEKMGAIKVSAAYAYEITAEPSGGDSCYIQHPDFKIGDNYLDRTPDGDYLLYLPAGFWDIKIFSEGAPVMSYYQTLGIPVNSGEITTIEVPYTLAANLSLSNGGYNNRGIEIGNVEETIEDNQVKMEFVLLDEKTKDIVPNKHNTIVSENGKECEILSIEHQDVPPEIVLLLDSSGSMRGQLQGTLKSAEEFIEGLPDGTNIRLIDFDTKVNLFDGTTKAEALKNINKIQVGGDTALYQAIYEGLEILSDKSRPTLVLFTDGENDLSGNEIYTKQMTLNQIARYNIPVLSIGFGEGHDRQTLKEISKVNNGLYFDAKDQQALALVFNSINERIASTYIMDYERPKIASIGNIPMMTFIIDTSGSMEDIDEGQGERMQNVKNLLYEFVKGMPKETQVQLMGFNDEVITIQTSTTNKLQLFRGLEKLEPGGGTEMGNALGAGISTIKTVPSTQKMLVFITDEALDSGSKSMQVLFDQIKAEGIRSLWVGIGLEDVKEDFKNAAELTNGDYIVTTDPNQLGDKIDELMNKAYQLQDKNLSEIHLQIEKENQLGERESYDTSVLKKLSEVKKNDEVIVSNTIRYHSGGILKQYDKKMADVITGYAIPSGETTITSRMLVDKNRKNDAVKLNADEVVFLDKLNGVDAPSGYRFMAINLKAENILEPQEVIVNKDGSNHPANWVSGGDAIETEMKTPTYLIPDFTSHFFISFNGSLSYPAQEATWLLNKPLASPGNNSIKITPSVNKSGALLFLVPDDALNQLSLHLYDTNYKTINLPIVGKLPQNTELLDTLPTEKPKLLSEALKIDVTKTIIKNPLPDEIELGEKSDIINVYGTIQSNIQALLDVNPAKRFSLELLTASGSFYVPLHPGTSILPFGMYNKRMLAPGSYNKSLWLFEIPNTLAGNKANLVLDLKGKDIVTSVKDGNIYPGSGQLYKGKDLSITINNIQKIKNKTLYGSTLIIDATIEDYKDDYSSQGIYETLDVYTFDKNNNQQEVAQYPYTNDLLLTFTNDTIIEDGTKKRGLLIYSIDEDAFDSAFEITSDYFEGLDLSDEIGTVEESLIAPKSYYEIDDEYVLSLEEAISSRIKKFQLTTIEFDESIVEGSIEGTSKEISIPSLNYYGYEQLKAINSVNDLRSVLKSLDYRPTERSVDLFQNIYSMESVLTQRYGTENDYANLAIRVLSSLGYTPKKKVIQLTEEGRQQLTEFSNSNLYINDKMPGVLYEEDGENHLLVLPFVEDLKDLDGLAYYNDEQYYEENPGTMYLQVFIEAYSEEKDRTQQVSDITDALAGETDSSPVLESIEMVTREISLPDASNDSLDVGITKLGNILKIFLIENNELILSSKSINLDKYDVKSIQFKFDSNEELTHEMKFDETRHPEDYFFTLSINSPDVTQKAVTDYQSKKNKVYQLLDQPSDLSSIRWHNRNIINNFIIGQSLEEEKLANELFLNNARTNEPRIIVVSNKGPRDQVPFETSINLVNVNTTIHKGDEKNIQSYNILSGIYRTKLESDVLGENGMGTFDLWEKISDDTEFILINSYDLYNNRDSEIIIESGITEEMIKRFGYENKYLLIPNKPIYANGRYQWAWLEIDPTDYSIISKLDTFENGAMVSKTIIDTVKSAGEYFVGAFVGTGTSIWSVAAVSLQEDDYNKILKDAKAFALGLKDNFGLKYGNFSMSVGKKPELSQKIGPVKFSFNGSPNASQDVLGFTQGYEAGVNYYFEKAQ